MLILNIRVEIWDFSNEPWKLVSLQNEGYCFSEFDEFLLSKIMLLFWPRIDIKYASIIYWFQNYPRLQTKKFGATSIPILQILLKTFVVHATVSKNSLMKLQLIANSVYMGKFSCIKFHETKVQFQNIGWSNPSNA